ncbi:tail fiber protein [Chromobacterium subtsugae]|uniref:Tail fiber protein n=1 Tax=Chromobacterium subtsugae TaxID=251747 RepID=A0ABS7FJQ7_9NEIS|nr:MULTISPECIES: tail fiber protein [Chromobacterium]KUM02266.1 hypothetical protein Cv017_03865 [Chromobacterium subtsugae]KZE86221.1 hypothetical protein AWB61_16930 [Chromobacterium sp. F49]MBW7568068.1 tail fiber protein [Chromobacterium subtsugae]MBW8289558.1 tail fiber protein [Chromobacterium subtsugae]WSE91980.1 phage tail protein [Chromobacterium subtsugae]
MQDPFKPIHSADGLFHDGNPTTGELGTVVAADWLNGMQSAMQATQQELLTVIQSNGQKTDPARQDQLLQAVQSIAWGGAQRPTTLAGYGIADGASKTDLKSAIDGVVAGAPGALNTLQELAAALGNDQNFAASIAKLLAGKADKATTLAGYGIADGATSTQVNAAAPAGMVAYFAMKDAPAGWLIADGRAVSRKDYPALFAAIGGLYGNGDGSTTFALPNLCGEFIRGWDNGRGVDTNRNFGTSQTEGIRDHKHAGLINSPYGDNWNYIYGYKNNGPTAPSGGVGAFPGNQTLPQITPVSHDGNPNNAIQTYITLNAASETRPRNVALLACIKC